MQARDAANGSARRLEQVYTTRTCSGLPLLADTICWAVRERVAVQIKAEFPVLIRIRRRLERQDQREDGSELGQNCRNERRSVLEALHCPQQGCSPLICDFGVTSLNVPCVSCSTMPLKPINEGFLARLTAHERYISTTSQRAVEEKEVHRKACSQRIRL